MKKNYFLVLIPTILLTSFFGLVLTAQAAAISCTFTDSSVGTCDALAKPPENCKIIDFTLMADQVKMSCDGYPKNYDCSSSGSGSIFTCNEQNFSCSAFREEAWQCTVTLSSPPANCTVHDAAVGSDYIECNGPPAGYSCAITHESGLSVTAECGTNTIPLLAAQQEAQRIMSGERPPLQTVTPSVPTNCPPGTPAGQLCYVPLEPLPRLEGAQSGTGNFRDLLQGFFKLLVNVGAFVAVTMLVIGGITYMISEATVTKFVAKEKIKAAFWGLAILAGAWLILNTINPQLLTFDKDLVEGATGSSSNSNQNVQNGGPGNSSGIEAFKDNCEQIQNGFVEFSPSGPVCKPIIP